MEEMMEEAIVDQVMEEAMEEAIMEEMAEEALEPSRVCRRLQTLRGWSHGNEEDLTEVFT